MKRLLLIPALLLIATAAQATLWNWVGTIDGRSEAAFGQIDVRADSLHNMSLTINDIVWQGRETPYDKLLPFPGSPRTWLSDIPMDFGDPMFRSGDLIFSYNNPQSGPNRWYLSIFTSDQDSTWMEGDVQSLVMADAAPVPEPSSMILMGSALLGLGGFRWSRRSRT